MYIELLQPSISHFTMAHIFIARIMARGGGVGKSLKNALFNLRLPKVRRILEKSTGAFDLSARSASSAKNSCFARFR